MIELFSEFSVWKGLMMMCKLLQRTFIHQSVPEPREYFKAAQSRMHSNVHPRLLWKANKSAPSQVKKHQILIFFELSSPKVELLLPSMIKNCRYSLAWMEQGKQFQHRTQPSRQRQNNGNFYLLRMLHWNWLELHLEKCAFLKFQIYFHLK